MCGIAGIVARNARVDASTLERATRLLSHRGPDDSGTIIIPAAPFEVGLGHTRLSIIDLSPLGHQPMQDPITGNWIVFNGEIYNFRELRTELEKTGAAFQSHSDTEVVLASYRVWGEEFLKRLEGMFAFALWDSQRRRLLLARDRMGIKPLYFCESPQAFVFASEVRTVVGTGLVAGSPDPAGVASFLAFGSVYEPNTIVSGIRALPPGNVLTLDERGVTYREYWNPLRAALPATEPPLSDVLQKAVLSHLVSDVPVGVFLSGGIDSSALVAILRNNGVRASTFSLVFQEQEFDEGQYSREVARHFEADHHEIPILPQETLRALPSALAAMDQPTIDGINTYLVSSKARAAGVKVALTGLGADEMFAGYSNFRRVPRLEALSRRFGRVPRFARRPFSASVGLLAGKGDRGRKLAELAADPDSMVHPYFLVRNLFRAAERSQLYAGDFQHAEDTLEATMRQSVAAASALDPVNRVSYLESGCYMRNTLLRDSDFMSMAHGLELRVPFLDRSLVEACFRIPGPAKLQGSRPKSLLLKSLGAELPRSITDRPKRGFTLPFEQWLRGEMRPVVEETLRCCDWSRVSLNPRAVLQVWERFLRGKTSWSRPWSLFVLSRWCEQRL